MKKYFLKETDEELQFGDTIILEMKKEMENGCTTVGKEVTFTEDLVSLLLESGMIEELEEDDSEDDPNDILDDFLMDFEALENKVDKLENLTLNVLKEMMSVIKELVKEVQHKENLEPKPCKKK